MSVLICLDPGHGGADRGAVGSSLLEKDVCLDLAYRVERQLLKYEGIRVTMTRTFDMEMSTEERIHWANQKQADLYLSFHNNSSIHAMHAGFTSYVSVFAGAKTRHLQRWLHNQIVFFLRQMRVLDLGKKNDTESLTGSLEVLRKTRMPAIALGSLFITNPDDHYLLTDSKFLDQYANCIANGLALIYRCPERQIETSPQVCDSI